MDILGSIDVHGLFMSLGRHIVISFVVWIIVLVAILLDLWDAIYTAKKLKEKIKSHRLRLTIQKICEYWRGLIIGLLIDSIGIFLPFYTLPYVTLVIGVGLLLVEAKSMFEHAKRRKSKTTELTKIINIIVDAANDKDAKKAIEMLTDYMNDDGKTVKSAFSTKDEC